MISVSLQAVRLALRGLHRLKPSKNKDAALRCVRIRGVEELVTFAAANAHEHLRYEALGASEVPGDLLVPFDLLNRVIKTADAGSSITFTPGPAPSLTSVVAETDVTTTIDPLEPAGLPAAASAEGPGIAVPPRAVRALHEAQEATSLDPTRGALHGVHLEPEAIVATDGRQLYAERGLSLAVPVPGLLIPRSPVIGLFDPTKAADLFVCRDPDGAVTHVKVFQGPWTWTVQLGDLRFPNWKQVVPRLRSLPTRVELSDADILQLGAVLPRLPGAETDTAPVWLCAGAAGVTVQSPPGISKVVLRLSTSRVTGPDVQVAFDRGYLLRALSHGFRVLHLRDAVTPVCMRDHDRIHLWMPVRLADPAPLAVAPEPLPQPATATV